MTIQCTNIVFSLTKICLFCAYLLSLLTFTLSSPYQAAADTLGFLEDLFKPDEQYHKECNDPAEYGLEYVDRIKACARVLTMDDVNELSKIWANWQIGMSYRQLKKFPEAQNYYTNVIKAWAAYNYPTKHSAQVNELACRAAYWIGDWKNAEKICNHVKSSKYEHDHFKWELSIFYLVTAYLELGRYYDVITHAERYSSIRRLSKLKEKALRALNKEEEADDLRQSSEQDPQAAADDASTLLETKVAKVIQEQGKVNDRYVAISFCPKLDLFGTSVHENAMRAGRNAYRKCIAKKQSTAAMECCKIIAQSGSQNCVSVVQALDGEIYTTEGKAAVPTAKTAIGICGEDCKVRVTKCKSDFE